MADRINEVIGRQRSFVSFAGHQLRSPLASLRIALDNIAPAPGERNRSYEIAVLEAERSAAIISALLDYAGVNARTTEVAVVDPVTALHDLVEARRPAAERAGVQLTLSGDGPLAVLVAPTLIDQAVDALIDNAVNTESPDHVCISRFGRGWPGGSTSRSRTTGWVYRTVS
jgi:signal transduction histidine kinase